MIVRASLLCAALVCSLSGQIDRLPALPDAAGNEWSREFAQIQVGIRTAAFKIDGKSAGGPWRETATLLPPSMFWRALPSATFRGDRISDLNRLIASTDHASIQVAAAELIFDEPLRIVRSNLQLDLAGAVLHPVENQPYAIRIENATQVILRNASITSAGLLVNASDSVVIESAVITAARSHAIVITGSNRVAVRHNRIVDAGGAGILIHRDSRRNIIQTNDILNGAGASNHMAGVVITDHAVDLAADPQAIFGPDQYWAVSQPMAVRTSPPQENVITRNRVSANHSSGIYVDGGVRNVIVDNIIDRNSKEGLCLDNGSLANVVADNTITSNGRRSGQSDQTLALDYVLAAGRLSDGTAAAKVPGISIDNAAYNLIYGNRVEGNYGGGIKLVRTGYFNIIGLNSIINNNAGAGPDYHFFGIELGAAPGDDASEELDFKPSRGNVIFSNIIRGNHYAGVFFGPGSDANLVQENIVIGADQWAIEAAAEGLANMLARNLSDKPNRNIPEPP